MMRISTWYFKPKPFEQNGELYEYLGVKTFKLLTPFELLYRIEKKKRWTFRRKKDVAKYFSDTKKGEVAHLISMIIIIVGCLILFFKDYWMEGILLAIANVMINVYPIILMRYNRFRILKIKNRLKKPGIKDAENLVNQDFK